MMKTVLCHFYNEEYLLPWWLSHHRKIFDHGIMVNYGSTDNSVDIIKQYCPTWLVVDTCNENFDPDLATQELEYYESSLKGARIALNVTEFLYGDYNNINLLDSPEPYRILIPCTSIIDPSHNRWYDPGKELLESCRPVGISYKDDFQFRAARSMHNCSITYPIGRHYYSGEISDMDLVIFWHGYAPWNEKIIKRKLSIGPKMPELTEQNKLSAWQHRVSREELFVMYKSLVARSTDMTEEVVRYKKLHDNYFINKGA
jgi:hypothetical protein